MIIGSFFLHKQSSVPAESLSLYRFNISMTALKRKQILPIAQLKKRKQTKKRIRIHKSYWLYWVLLKNMFGAWQQYGRVS